LRKKKSLRQNIQRSSIIISEPSKALVQKKINTPNHETIRPLACLVKVRPRINYVVHETQDIRSMI